jgi:hypothetical protein
MIKMAEMDVRSMYAKTRLATLQSQSEEFLSATIAYSPGDRNEPLSSKCAWAKRVIECLLTLTQESIYQFPKLLRKVTYSDCVMLDLDVLQTRLEHHLVRSTVT